MDLLTSQDFPFPDGVFDSRDEAPYFAVKEVLVHGVRDIYLILYGDYAQKVPDVYVATNVALKRPR